MSIQPVDRSSTMPAPVLPAMPGSDDADRPRAASPKTNKTKLTRNDAVRAAKARILRRTSLRKQRQAQKG
jgi:hypothetical protein